MSRILIVDDDESILDAVSLILEESGFDVDTTFKGEETYAKISQFNPNLILLDVLMSGSDGRQICQKLKQQQETKKIPIIMISAHPTAKEGAVQCGANDFLAKPFDTDVLITKINHLLQLPQQAL